MRHLGLVLLLAVCGLMGTGFIESSRIIKVNKNGTGSIFVRVLYNPAELEEDQQVHDVEKLKKAIYGKGVRFVLSKEVEGKNGWKGYLAKYHFSDLKEIRVFPGSLPRAAKAEEGDEIRLSGWRFKIREVSTAGLSTEDDDKAPIKKETVEKKPKKKAKKGEADKMYVLDIIPLTEDENDGAEGDGDDDDDDDDDDGKAAAEDLELRALQKGRRYVTYIQVEGNIVSARTKLPQGYLSAKRPNTVVLNDEQFEVMWGKSAVARTEISAEEPNFARLDPQKTDGYRVITKKSRIAFK